MSSIARANADSTQPELVSTDMRPRRTLDCLTPSWVAERVTINETDIAVRWRGETQWQRWTTRGQPKPWSVRMGVYETLDEARAAKEAT